ncbi:MULTISPECIES: LysR family transcriptional regulator [unclassified Burkholderia]|uniref:LysR family transcriptional regulator n=1 Tax=unclassified Burkholderia TaxID=2613784 RepID=UPI000F586573|nr:MULTISPECIES: LysR family transcriptional regulator [unclassified Burkholderia]RQR47087.1 LysR family transcriptional regulator [Burkholderia sp. Bp9131]RQR79975.1 LysR family transcriptional regulator [Burkholderia sp. Bp9015]RQS01965.1 LysR family transcriptional regulator [Burkholderia sp. Bp8994]RQS35134.1 LysR family transcriptional regulator [Burkholderia sp. Bp8995]RQS45458.1 LysR family transcriptional regulator [Burkholderia sp. Bp8990]
MQILPDLEAWAIFAHVLETGSFVRAAEALDLSQPTVSKAISRLERRLGTALFYRNSRQVSLTAAGEIAKSRAIRILSEAAAAETEASSHATELRGLVRVAVPMSFASRHVAPLIPAFLERYPQVEIDLCVTDRIVDVVGGGFDVAVLIAELADSSLRARRLCAVNHPLVASPAYLKRWGRPTHPRDLARHACLVYTGLATPELWQFRHTCGDAFAVTVRGIIRSNSADVIVPALLAGRGVALQPEFVVRDALMRGELVDVLPEWRIDPVGVNLVTPPSSLRPLRVTAFLDYLAERLAAAPWAVAGA